MKFAGSSLPVALMPSSRLLQAAVDKVPFHCNAAKLQHCKQSVVGDDSTSDTWAGPRGSPSLPFVACAAVLQYQYATVLQMCSISSPSDDSLQPNHHYVAPVTLTCMLCGKLAMLTRIKELAGAEIAEAGAVDTFKARLEANLTTAARVLHPCCVGSFKEAALTEVLLTGSDRHAVQLKSRRWWQQDV